MTFDDALVPILALEGGYVNDPLDAGGATNKGVTQVVYDAFRKQIGAPQRSVLSITLDEVHEIYYANYWRDGHCYQLPTGVALVHFDMCVNAGISRASKILQSVVGTTQDGQIGPKTLDALGKLNPLDVVYSYSQARREFYERLVERKPTNSKFLKGWLKRVADIERRAVRAISNTGTSTTAS